MARIARRIGYAASVVAFTLYIRLAGEHELAGAEALAASLGARATDLADDPLALVALIDAAPDAAALIGFDAVVEPAALLDWGSQWRATPRPLALGPLWIVPAGAAAPRDGRPCVHIDASSAFGSGLHPTTRVCLDWIVARAPLGTVLDVGTGTGVLGLAALAAGASRVVGTDVDPLARAAARANAVLSGLPLEVPEAPLPGDARFDVVLANMLGPELIMLAPELVRRLGASGVLLLSGVRWDDRDEVIAAFVRQGLACCGVEAREGWAMVELLARW